MMLQLLPKHLHCILEKIYDNATSVELHTDLTYTTEENLSYLSNFLNVKLVDKCIRKLKMGKARGRDCLKTKHLINAHPIL